MNPPFSKENCAETTFIYIYLKNFADVISTETNSSWTLPCSTFCFSCKEGGSEDGGVPLVDGKCTRYCSALGHCGSFFATQDADLAKKVVTMMVELFSRMVCAPAGVP